MRWLARQLPRLGILPGNVNRVVEMQEKAFATIEEAEAEKVVVNKCEERTQHDVDDTETDFSVRGHHLCAE